MAVAHTTVLQLLGKYVSFNSDSCFETYGVISNVVFNMDGTVEISIGWDEFYDYSKITNLKVMGEVHLYPS
ncbi:hypothetical protein [Acinetobacter colistiniresistens]|jgi:hypothetical protein|uniref:hypothetical protein n=1 Tax=Acinetobacter colistiniresistens TaxID=280145 RepID=UPI000E5A4598|nr:hypothetical protein [Acinetobacter colistiniresistens]